jgi:hypothetical protein
VAKLDGTFKIPTTAGATVVEQTELQQSIFNAPPPGSAFEKPTVPATSQGSKNDDTDENRGQKRTRDEEDEESEEDVAMEEDSDDE